MKTNGTIYAQFNERKTNITYNNQRQTLNYRDRYIQNVSQLNQFEGINSLQLGTMCNSVQFVSIAYYYTV